MLQADFPGPSMKPEFLETARRSILLSTVPEPVLGHVLGAAQQREYDRGETIFLQGERAEAIYIVASGWVKLFRVSPNGAEAVVSIFSKGHSFGEAVAFQRGYYPVAAQAVTKCSLIRINADIFLRLIHESPEIAISMLSAAYRHLQQHVIQIEALKAQTGAQRVAEFLLELAPCAAGACEVTFPYDKALIAGSLGMKPESLSRAFAKLRDQGVKVRQNQAAIADVSALRDFAAEDPATAWSR